MWSRVLPFGIVALSLCVARSEGLCQGLQTGQGTWQLPTETTIPRYNQNWACPDWAKYSSTGFSCWRSYATNASLVEQEAAWRWRPNQCPEYRDFDPVGFVSCLGSRRMFLIGDSIMWQQFASLACLLHPYVKFSEGSQPTNGSFMYTGQIQLITGAEIVGKAFGLADDGKWEQALAPYQPMREDDVLVVNFGAHYAHLHPNKYHNSIAAFIWNKLRPLPLKRILWRQYAPSHYPGSEDASGQFQPEMVGKQYTCEPAWTGEPWIDGAVDGILHRCGAECDHIEWMKIQDLTLPRWRAHNGVYNSWSKDQESEYGMDCRHYCFFILDEYNSVMYNQLCPASPITLPTAQVL